MHFVFMIATILSFSGNGESFQLDHPGWQGHALLQGTMAQEGLFTSWTLCIGRFMTIFQLMAVKCLEKGPPFCFCPKVRCGPLGALPSTQLNSFHSSAQGNHLLPVRYPHARPQGYDHSLGTLPGTRGHRGEVLTPG